MTVGGAERRRIRADRQRIRAGRGRYQSMLDRQATPADLEQLREFTRTRRGVELYIEPETSATDTRLSQWPTTVSGSAAGSAGEGGAGIGFGAGRPRLRRHHRRVSRGHAAYRRPDDRTT